MSSQETTDNFWSAFNAWEPQEELKPPPYRVYYNEQGYPIFLTNEDLPGNYIEIDRETYVDFPKYVRIVDGKLVLLQVHSVSKLVPADQGTACHPQDVSVVVGTDQPHQLWELNDKH
jgi:hypothetical protein